MLLTEYVGAHKVTPEARLAYILISIGLVLLAGLMSGLTLGLMSMDAVDLEVLLMYYASQLAASDIVQAPSSLNADHFIA